MMITKLILSSLLAGLVGLTAHAETVESKHYKITDEGVFYLSGVDEPLLLPYANPKTFVVLDDYVAKDGQHVYQNGRYVYHFDVSSFESIGDSFFKDDMNVYISYPKVNKFGFCTSVLNNFELLPVKPYAKDDRYIYIDGKRQFNFDVKSFIPLDYFYSKDNNHVYYGGSVIKGADPYSFTVIDSRAKLSKDKNAIYYGGNTIAGLNTDNFFWINPMKGNSTDDPDLTWDERYRRYGDYVPLIKDEQFVFYRDEEIEDADPASFQMINSKFYKDKSNIYFKNKSIESVNIDSFTIIQGGYAKDMNHVYFNGEILKNADPDSFLVISEYLSKDKNIVFRGDKIIEYIDPETVEIVNQSPIIIKDKNSVYNMFGEKTNVDAKSIKVLSNNIIKDKDNVYFLYDWNILPVDKADPLTFEILNSDLARDKQYVYDLGLGMPSIYDNKKMNPKTIDSLNHSLYLKDDQRVYWLGKEIISADPKSFKTLTDSYSIDHKSVYFLEKKIKNSDPKTFRILNNWLVTQDDQNVFYREHTIKGADAKSFIALNNYFGKDKNNIYAFLVHKEKVQIFKNSEPQSFELLRGKRDAQTPYAKDKHNVYYQNGHKGVIIKGADPLSFEALEYGRGKDKNGCYAGEKKVDCE